MVRGGKTQIHSANDNIYTLGMMCPLFALSFFFQKKKKRKRIFFWMWWVRFGRCLKKKKKKKKKKKSQVNYSHTWQKIHSVREWTNTSKARIQRQRCESICACVYTSAYVYMHMYLWVCAHMYTYACLLSRWWGQGLLGNGGGQASLWIKAKVRAAAVAHVQGEWRPQMALH